MLSKTLILLIISSFVYASDDCDIAKCAKPLKHHEELGCKANFDDGKCCPSYDCSDYSKLDPAKCHFNGEEYEVGQALSRNVSGLTCTQSCFCSRSEEQPAKFICAQQSCGNFQSQSCVNVYGSLDECCSTASICDNDQKSALSTCYLNDKLYYEGQKMYSEADPCYVCLCQKNFDNSTIAENKNCQKINCGIELHSMSYIQKGCIPIYLEKKACCPISWKCPSEESSTVASKSANENIFVVTPAAATSEEQDSGSSESESSEEEETKGKSSEEDETESSESITTTTEKFAVEVSSEPTTTTAALENTEVPAKLVETTTVAKEAVQLKELPAAKDEETPEAKAPKDAEVTTTVEPQEAPATSTTTTTTEKPKAIIIEAVPVTSTEPEIEVTTVSVPEEAKFEATERSTKAILDELTTILAEAVEEVTTLKESEETETEATTERDESKAPQDLTTTESSSDIQTSFEGHTEHVSISVSIQTSESATKERKKRSSIYQLPTILRRVVRELSDSTKNQCIFGSKNYNIGEQIADDDECLSCSCEIPPLAHCIRKLNCN